MEGYLIKNVSELQKYLGETREYTLILVEEILNFATYLDAVKPTLPLSDTYSFYQKSKDTTENSELYKEFDKLSNYFNGRDILIAGNPYLQNIVIYKIPDSLKEKTKNAPKEEQLRMLMDEKTVPAYIAFTRGIVSLLKKDVQQESDTISKSLPQNLKSAINYLCTELNIPKRPARCAVFAAMNVLKGDDEPLVINDELIISGESIDDFCKLSGDDESFCRALDFIRQELAKRTDESEEEEN